MASKTSRQAFTFIGNKVTELIDKGISKEHIIGKLEYTILVLLENNSEEVVKMLLDNWEKS